MTDDGHIELLTTDEMGRADQLAIAGGVAGIDLMERAGAAVADEVWRRYPCAESVAVLCGPGNNGGDGFVAARLLVELGYKVRLALLGDRQKLKGDAAAMADLWASGIDDLSSASIAGADIIVDAIFGAGLTRVIDGPVAEVIDAVNGHSAPVVAVDVPSGIDGSTGEVRGTAVRAAATVTFFRRKPGHLLLPGRLHMGDVRVADIGIPDEVLHEIEPMTRANSLALWGNGLPVPQLGDHKYSRGHALIVSGGPDSTGAARLGARGALRAGAGLVTLASPRAAFPVNAAQLTAIMIKPFEGADGLAKALLDTRKNAVLIGPGIGVGESTASKVGAVLSSEAAVVLDADALTSFEADTTTLFGAIAGRNAEVVLTPHMGEFSRLFPEPHGCKLECARSAAAESGAVVILKGADTVIAAPDGRAAINNNAPAWLATAGSGDVLAGFVTGLLAQHMPAYEAACAAVWLHGAAGNAAGPGLIAEDLTEVMPSVWRETLASLSAAQAGRI